MGGERELLTFSGWGCNSGLGDISGQSLTTLKAHIFEIVTFQEVSSSA